MIISKKLNELDLNAQMKDSEQQLQAQKTEHGQDGTENKNLKISDNKIEFSRVIRKIFVGEVDKSDQRIHEITMDLLQRIDQDHSG